MHTEFNIRRNYDGYLKPYLSDIERMATGGMAPLEIAHVLFQRGAKSEWDLGERNQIASISGLVRHILHQGPLDSRRHKIATAKKRVVRLKAELVKAKARLKELQET